MQKDVIILEPIHVIGTPYLEFPLPPLFPFSLPPPKPRPNA